MYGFAAVDAALPPEWIGWQLLKASVVIQNTQRNNGNPQQGTRGVCVLDTEQTLPDRAGGKLSPSALATPSGKSDKCGCLTKNVTYFNYTNHLLTQQDGRAQFLLHSGCTLNGRTTINKKAPRVA